MSTDQGTTTRVGIRTIYASPPVAASGPTPGLPTTNEGQYSNQPGAVNGQFESLALSTQQVGGNPIPATVPKKYKMCGQDHSVNGSFDTWVVSYAPDFTGAQYTGGLNTPLRDIFICG